MTSYERYRGLLTISVILDGILEEAKHMLLERMDEPERKLREKHIAKLELSRKALEETRRRVDVERTKETA